MPKIKTNKGWYRYNTCPLFPGVKIINKEKSRENLLLLKSVLDENNIRFGLIAGTLLGAVREHDFINHDEDTDLFLLEEDKQKLINTLFYLRNKGFEVVRYDRRGVISVMRNGEYTDLYFFKSENGYRNCSGWVILPEFLENFCNIEFLGVQFCAPADYRGYLRCQYGDDWETPIQYFTYKKPWWKLLYLKACERAKDLLPDFIYFKLAKKAERTLFERNKKRIETYLRKIEKAD